MNTAIATTYEPGARRALGAALLTGAIAASLSVYAPRSEAGATFKIDDTKWVSIGAGLRTSFTSQEGSTNTNGWSNDFNLDNIRLYLSGQVHKYFKMEFNTD